MTTNQDLHCEYGAFRATDSPKLRGSFSLCLGDKLALFSTVLKTQLLYNSVPP